MTKNKIDHRGETGNLVTTSGYTIKASPAPWSTTRSTPTLSSWAKKPITENITRPAKNEVPMFDAATINESL